MSRPQHYSSDPPDQRHPLNPALKHPDTFQIPTCTPLGRIGPTKRRTRHRPPACEAGEARQDCILTTVGLRRLELPTSRLADISRALVGDDTGSVTAFLWLLRNRWLPPASTSPQKKRPGDSSSHVESRQLVTQPSDPRANCFLIATVVWLRFFTLGRAKQFFDVQAYNRTSDLTVGRVPIDLWGISLQTILWLPRSEPPRASHRGVALVPTAMRFRTRTAARR